MSSFVISDRSDGYRSFPNGAPIGTEIPLSILRRSPWTLNEAIQRLSEECDLEIDEAACGLRLIPKL